MKYQGWGCSDDDNCKSDEEDQLLKLSDRDKSIGDTWPACNGWLDEGTSDEEVACPKPSNWNIRITSS